MVVVADKKTSKAFLNVHTLLVMYADPHSLAMYVPRYLYQE